MAHAIAYAQDEDGIHVYDLWMYRGKFPSLATFLRQFYPTYDVIFLQNVETKLTTLFQEGHLQFFPTP